LEIEGVPAILPAVCFIGALKHTKIVSAELEFLLQFFNILFLYLYGTLLYGFVFAGCSIPILSSLTPVNCFFLGSDSSGVGCEHGRDESDLLHFYFENYK